LSLPDTKFSIQILQFGQQTWTTPVINAFLLSATQMWLQPLSYLAMSVKKAVLKLPCFLLASLHSVAFHCVPVTGLMT